MFRANGSARGLPRLLAPTGADALGGVVAAIVNAAMRVAVLPLLIAPLFDRVLIGGETDALPTVLLSAGVVIVIGSIALWAQDGLLATAAARVSKRWRAHLYARLLRRRPGTLPGTSGGLASRILADLREIETYFQFGLGTVVAESATIVGIVAYLFWTDPQATALLVAFGAPTWFALHRAGRAIEHFADRSQRGVEDLGRHLQEGFRHHAVVRAFRVDDLLLRRMQAVNRATARAMRARGLVAGAQTPIAQILVFAAVAGLMLFLYRRVLAGALSAGEMIAFLSLIALLATPLQLLPRGVALLQQARVASRRLHELDDGCEERRFDDGPAPATDPAAPPLALRDLRIGYADAPSDGAVLDGVTLDFPHHGLVAVVGASGSGKTTLLQTLVGFLPTLHGRIDVNGVPLGEWPDAALRRELAFVPQELDLLSGSLRDNLALVGDDRLVATLEAVGLDDLFASGAGALDAELGEDGRGLSGGQRQRISIARAVLGDPSILLLDEPTSALDDATERALIDLLRDQARARLVVAVAHRPALAEAADAVLEVADGAATWRAKARRAEPTGSRPPTPRGPS